MKDEKKAEDVMEKKTLEAAGAEEELSDDNLDEVTGGMSFQANQNLTPPKNSH